MVSSFLEDTSPGQFPVVDHLSLVVAPTDPVEAIGGGATRRR
jgi:hypothetical protein